MNRSIFVLVAMLGFVALSAQDIPITNRSFEGENAFGRLRVPFRLDGWFDCGAYIFPRETPPDVHPISQWGNLEKPLDGETFVGLVVRENNTWESITQRLVAPIKGGQCYEFSIAIKAAENYLSQSSYRSQHFRDTSRVQFTQPTVLRIWGGITGCDQEELLGESPAVQKQDWQRYTYTFQPKADYNYIMLEAFYKVPVPNMRLYNGHIMIDDASDLVAIPCPQDQDIYAEVKDIEPSADVVTTVPSGPAKNKKAPQLESEKKAPQVVVNKPAPKKKKNFKILTDLNTEKLKAGQIIRVKKLFFHADDYTITQQSAMVLDELYNFLADNPSIRLEIGGHTNGQPSVEHCNRLSTQRANAVAKYLIDRGITKDRLETKGYGKNKPIASNKTLVGRKRNQRVEIKILNV